MSIERIPDQTDYIASLADRPNDQDGLSAAELKQRFDQGVTDIKAYINQVLLPALETAGAAALGITEISGVDVEDPEIGTRPAENIQEALEALKAAVDSAALGDLPDYSLTARKLAQYCVTSFALDLLSVGTEHLKLKAVTGDNVDDETLETRCYKGRSVTGAIIALGAIANEHLGSGIVEQANMARNSVGADQLIDGSVSYVKTAGVQKKHTTKNNIGIEVADWNSSNRATVNAAGVTAGNTVILEAYTDATSTYAYNWPMVRDCGVRCIAQGNGTLTFEAETKPTRKLWFVAAIFDQ